MFSQTTEGHAQSRPDSWPSTIHAIRQHGIPRHSVEAVHLPSTLQETMIMSTSMDPKHQLYMETYHFTSHPIDPSLLNSALHTLASKHSTLRTIVCWNKDHPGSAVSLAVLDAQYMHHHARLFWPSADLKAHETAVRVKFYIYGKPDSSAAVWDGEMPWEVSVAPIPNTTQHRLTLIYHHAIMDGTSVRKLLHWIREEMEFLGSVVHRSDIMSVTEGLSTWRRPEMRMRLSAVPSTNSRSAPARDNCVKWLWTDRGCH